MWLPNCFLSNLGGIRTWRDHGGVEWAHPGFHKKKNRWIPEARVSGAWHGFWQSCRVNWKHMDCECSEKEAVISGSQHSLKQECQAQLTSSYYWKRLLAECWIWKTLGQRISLCLCLYSLQVEKQCVICR